MTHVANRKIFSLVPIKLDKQEAIKDKNDLIKAGFVQQKTTLSSQLASVAAVVAK